jgi:drug/metabolite transporter (DMT)-like permease
MIREYISGIPKITGKLFGKIVLTAILVGFMNALIVFGHRELDSQGYGVFIMIAICITVYPIIVTISILFFNLFKKEKISDLELIIYFVILLGVTIMQTVSLIEEFSG